MRSSWWLLALVLALVTPLATNADQVTTSGITLQDEGVDQGRVQKLNCTGAGVTCSKSGAVGTINATGGSGSFSISEAEIDFGNSEVFFDGVFTVVDASINSAHRLLVNQSGEAPTGKDEDENEMDALALRAVAGTGQFTLYVTCHEGCHGTFKINYSFS